MKKTFQLAAAEKGLGFFSFNPGDQSITWDEETARLLGIEPGEKKYLAGHFVSGLRTYLLRGLASGSRQRFRCLIPLQGGVMEMVVLPSERGAAEPRDGFLFPYSLHEPMEVMKKYFLSNISNKLRSLLNSVIIASDVLAASDKDSIWEHRKFLGLMADDAREVNTLLNRLGEIGSYSHSAAPGHAENLEVRPLLAAVHANLQYLAEDASIALDLALPESMPTVRGNPIHFMLAFFLTIHYALSKTEPLGEIIITAGERDGWVVEISFANGGVPTDLAVSPEKHNLAPVVVESWSEGAGLQLIDSLLGLYGSSLDLLSSGGGLGLLKLRLPR